MYVEIIQIIHNIEYNTHISSTEIWRAIIILIMYHAGAAINAKKYSRNQLRMSFFLSGSSGKINVSHSMVCNIMVLISKC